MNWRLNQCYKLVFQTPSMPTNPTLKIFWKFAWNNKNELVWSEVCHITQGSEIEEFLAESLRVSNLSWSSENTRSSPVEGEQQIIHSTLTKNEWIAHINPNPNPNPNTPEVPPKLKYEFSIHNPGGVWEALSMNYELHNSREAGSVRPKIQKLVTSYYSIKRKHSAVEKHFALVQYYPSWKNRPKYDFFSCPELHISMITY